MIGDEGSNGYHNQVEWLLHLGRMVVAFQDEEVISSRRGERCKREVTIQVVFIGRLIFYLGVGNRRNIGWHTWGVFSCDFLSWCLTNSVRDW